MLTVLVTGPTVTQNSLFSSLAVDITITSTHVAYPLMDDQAELAWVAWLNTKMVTHLSCCCSDIPAALSYRQLSRLRKSATAAGLSHRSCTGYDG